MKNNHHTINNIPGVQLTQHESFLTGGWRQVLLYVSILAEQAGEGGREEGCEREWRESVDYPLPQSSGDVSPEQYLTADC